MDKYTTQSEEEFVAYRIIYFVYRHLYTGTINKVKVDLSFINTFCVDLAEELQVSQSFCSIIRNFRDLRTGQEMGSGMRVSKAVAHALALHNAVQTHNYVVRFAFVRSVSFRESFELV